LVLICIMSDTVIKVENVRKKYRIRHEQRERYTALRDVLVRQATVPVQWLLRRGGRSNGQRDNRQSANGTSRSAIEDFWALYDVSLEVKQDEVIGIIGRNGAGKSTLLKILSRITEPTEGRVRIRGRVASLLEVGTGFHPELTGRENIFLNGAILGMTKAEIKNKFDEIIAFAEIEKFLDTPVKRYSSGMYVRLAFAVAAHLEPEILLVDEVLAVGDAQFQKKCLGKMGEVAKEGRTVLFVSHNIVAVQSMCRRAIWLENGKIVEEGPSRQVVTNYAAASLKGTALSDEIWDDIETAPGNHAVRLHRVRVRPQDGCLSDPLTVQKPFLAEIEYWNLVPATHLHITLHLYTQEGVIAFTTGSRSECVWRDRRMPPGLFRSVCFFPGDLLNSGRHRFTVLIVKDTSSLVYQHESAVSLDIFDLKEREGAWYGKEPGVVRPKLKWTTEYVSGIPDTCASAQ
jgi:lipopolysaccharide transport system ATP-binding protein